MTKSTATSSTAMDAQRIIARAEEIFGDRERAMTWLSRRHPLLGGKQPLDLLGVQGGAQAVDAELTKIEGGFPV